jgi:hypothetical protein
LDPHPEEILVSTNEPLIHLRNLPNRTTYYFRVTSVDSEGKESDFSNEEHVYVNLSQFGQNMIYNGDFSSGFLYWQWYLDSTNALAQWEIDSTETLQCQITNGGTDFSHVRVVYPNLQLIEGREYLFEYDAHVVEDRVIEADIKKLTSPYTNYSKIGYTLISKSNTHYTQTFTMEDMTEFSAAIVFNIGNSEQDISIDNVSLKEVVTGIYKKDQISPTRFALNNNYPNPFNPRTTISYSIPVLCNVKITVYNLIGERVKQLIDRPHNPGFHKIEFNSKNISSGLYFYELIASGVNNSMMYYDVKKMMVIK